MQNNKLKVLIIILINILFVAGLLVIFEGYYWHKTAKEYTDRKTNPYPQLISFNDTFKIFEKKWIRKPEGIKYKGKPLVIFGGSFGYGTGLMDDQTVAYKMSEQIKKPVYNRAYPGGSPPQMLFQLTETNIFQNVPEPDYVLYVYTEDEMSRVYRDTDCLPTNTLVPKYKMVNGKLKRVEPNKIELALLHLYAVREFNEKVLEPFLAKDKERTFNLFFEIFKESKEIIDNKWHNPKFFILKYPIYRTGLENKPDCSEAYSYYEGWNKFKDIGITVIEMQSLVGNEVCSPDYIVDRNFDYHPNEAAWDKIVPKLIEKMQIK